jgi:hypothetical protein
MCTSEWRGGIMINPKKEKENKNRKIKTKVLSPDMIFLTMCMTS